MALENSKQHSKTEALKALMHSIVFSITVTKRFAVRIICSKIFSVYIQEETKGHFQIQLKADRTFQCS